jgi:hypothetical protein
VVTRRALWALLFLTGCRDLTTPPQPGPGSIAGRVVYGVPGRADLKPAGGTVVTVLGSGLSAVANQAGTFTLTPLEETEGLLLFSFDSDGDGTIDRQKVERLADWKTGPHKAVQMGDVVLGENAAVHGKVLLADHPGAKTGLGGSAIFVPEGPFAAYTADDGSYLLPNLPEGPLQFFVFHAGYTATSLGTVALRAGEEYAFRDLTLSVATGPMVPGTLLGSLRFLPAATGKGDTQIAAASGSGSPILVTPDDDLGFRFASIPAGLYTLTVTRSAYTPARVPNVLVLPGAEASVGAIIVTDVPIPDAGQLTMTDAGTPDAGSSDAGMDGGFDAGACTGPFCKPCQSNAQCSTTEWCDNAFCAPQCSSTSGCTNNRACDSVTRTCVRLCSSGCGVGQVCESSTNICRFACDVAFPCAKGFKCDGTSRCVPECAVQADCGSVHIGCVAGECVPTGTCDDDRDCATDTLCLLGNCVARPTARIDGGSSPFTCAMPCQCRLGEVCSDGLCNSDQLPTMYFKADGGGDGTSIAKASSALEAALATAGPGALLAVRAGDTFFEPTGFHIPRSDVTLAGGYQECSPNRWVRDEAARSTLASTDLQMLSVIGTTAKPLSDVTVRNFVLKPAASYGCAAALMLVDHTLRLTVNHLEGALVSTAACSGADALLHANASESLELSNLVLQPSISRGASVSAIYLNASSGTVTAASAAAQPGPFVVFELVHLEVPTGPTVIRGCTNPRITASGASSAITAVNCLNQPLLIEDNDLTWGLTTGGGFSTRGIGAFDCRATTIRDNRIDGSATNGAINATQGIYLSQGGGTIEGNVVFLPSTPGGPEVTGIYLDLAGGPLTVRNNAIIGGQTQGPLEGILANGLNAGPVLINNNTVDVGPTYKAYGMLGDANTQAAAVRYVDNFIRATGNGICGGFANGLTVQDNAAALIERNRAFASNGQSSIGLTLVNDQALPIEAYSNHFSAGSASCSGQSIAVYVNNSVAVTLKGNTLDSLVDPFTTPSTAGIACTFGNIVADSNLIGGGNAPSHLSLYEINGASCFVQANYTRNYLWHRAALPAIAASDRALSIVDAGLGAFDDRGNYLAQNLSPFDAVQPLLPDGGTQPASRLSATTVALDRGPPPLRVDGTPVWLDLDKRARDAGASADLGCCERY